ncbi:hypothetical protein DEO72_LG10g1881 [Vigna unguiculata]|uniref:Uncharacterized protein n=1 Tax=Vigna unguiculata TaxID=3917 RepID=A0A4D6N9V1_VIGUN|nr:hypothetical protein DEO72_LG10g1881 [Vigna unguiculata]
MMVALREFSGGVKLRRFMELLDARMEKMVVCSRWLAVAAEMKHAICGCRFVVALCGEDDREWHRWMVRGGGCAELLLLLRSAPAK